MGSKILENTCATYHLEKERVLVNIKPTNTWFST